MFLFCFVFIFLEKVPNSWMESKPLLPASSLVLFSPATHAFLMFWKCTMLFPNPETIHNVPVSPLPKGSLISSVTYLITPMFPIEAQLALPEDVFHKNSLSLSRSWALFLRSLWYSNSLWPCFHSQTINFKKTRRTWFCSPKCVAIA